MKKILLIVNAHKPDTASIQFAAHLANRTKSLLTGLLVENVYHQTEKLKSEKTYFKTFTEQEEDSVTIMDTTQAGKLFWDICQYNGVEPMVQYAQAEPIQETLYHSRFSDVLVIDPKTDFYELNDSLPSHFSKEMLANAECPVLLAPDKQTSINEIVFCFDGGAASSYALKQFTYLFPDFSNTPIVLLEINNSGKEKYNEGHQHMMAWLKENYQQVSFHLLEGSVKDQLFTYFLKKTDKLVVMGSYGRSALSSFFKRSTADVLIRNIDLPLFITH